MAVSKDLRPIQRERDWRADGLRFLYEIVRYNTEQMHLRTLRKGPLIVVSSIVALLVIACVIFRALTSGALIVVSSIVALLVIACVTYGCVIWWLYRRYDVCPRCHDDGDKACAVCSGLGYVEIVVAILSRKPPSYGQRSAGGVPSGDTPKPEIQGLGVHKN
jgi:hypothetical protein